MLDGALFKQETSNIIEDTFSAYNICKGRMFEEINNDTACVLVGSEKYIKRRTRFCSTRIFCKWFWQLDPKPPTVCQIRQYQ